MTMQLIQTQTVSGSSVASIEFTSIPQSYTDLVVLTSLRGDLAALVSGLGVALNGSTSGFTYRRLVGDGATVVSNTNTQVGLVNGSTSTSNTFSNGFFYFPNYTSSVAKSFSGDAVTENNSSTASQALAAGSWSGTAAISSMSFSATTGNLVSGSTISLYGILKGSDGIVTTS